MLLVLLFFYPGRQPQEFDGSAGSCSDWIPQGVLQTLRREQAGDGRQQGDMHQQVAAAPIR